MPSKIHCRKREMKCLYMPQTVNNSKEGQVLRVEMVSGIALSPTQVFMKIRRNWRLTNLGCRSTREHLTWLLLSNGPYKLKRKLMDYTMLNKTTILQYLKCRKALLL